jgi:hypothetical protein
LGTIVIKGSLTKKEVTEDEVGDVKAIRAGFSFIINFVD